MPEDEELTVLVRPGGSGGAAGAVPRRGEAQHRGVVLGELLQARHVAHVDAVLEVGPHDHRGNVAVSPRLPGEELEETKRTRGGACLRERTLRGSPWRRDSWISIQRRFCSVRQKHL